MAPAKAFGRDFSASFLVFLVALPLCLGIAVASGVPPARGLVTGIVGGLLAGALAGAPLAVSGPAAGLTVLVFQIVSQHGLAVLGPVVALAGCLQIAAGAVRLGGYARLMPAAIVEGMLAAIGLTLAAAQLHVMAGTAPSPGFVANLRSAPEMLRLAALPPLALGAVTIAAVKAWEAWRPAALREVPGAVPAVLLATLLDQILPFPVAHIGLPARLDDAVALLRPEALRALAQPAILAAAVSLALIASLESLLSVAAIDRMTPRRRRSDYSRELMAQGAGNVACGVLGALPMTGVIVRSAANVRAGARTRLSTVLHGAWLLAAVALAPGALRLIPTASLAGLLVLVGARLVEPRHVRALAAEGALPIACYGVTVGVILANNLLTGVVAGLVVYAVGRVARRGASGGQEALPPAPSLGPAAPNPMTLGPR